MVRVLVDTASDILEREAKELGVELVKIPIQFEDGEFVQTSQDDFDLFYERLKKAKNLPSTSQPSFGELVDKFIEIKESGDEAIYIALSSGISSTYSSAVTALEQVDYDRIAVIDSLTASTSQMQLTEIAVKWRDEGYTFDKLIGELERIKRHNLILHNVDTLTYLKKGGRVPTSIAMIGNALNLKPMLTINGEGKLNSLKKDRGRKASFKSLVSTLQSYGINQDYPVQVIYTSNKDMGEELESLLKEVAGIKETRLVQMGGVVGTHIGPNGVGLAAIVEKDIFSED